MTFEEQKIYNYIKRWHCGRDRAITFKELANNLKINARELRSVVARLVTEHGALIATTSDLGYFFVENEEDFNHAKAEIISRIDKLRKRLNGLERGWEESSEPQKTLFEMEGS